MNPTRDPLARATFPSNDQPTIGYSPNIVNVPNQAHFQASGKAPPLPPIPPQLMSAFQQPSFQNNMGYSTMNRYTNYPGFGPSYNNFYNGYRGNPNPYSGFIGNYGNGMPGNNNPDSPFSSIELFVQTVSSLSMMLESTLNATYTSMQAVAGVMDNCNRLRQYLIDFLKLGFTIQFVRRIINFCKWVVCFIRGKTFIEEESLWNAAKSSTVLGVEASSVETGSEVVQRGSVWPLAAFFGLLIGGPYIIKRFFKLSTPNGNSMSSVWDPNVHGKQACIAIYDFKPSQNGCLKLKAGEIICIPKTLKFNDWCPAMNQRKEIGLVPTNRIRPVTLNATIKASVENKNAAATVTKEKNVLQPDNVTSSSAPCTYSVDLNPLEDKAKIIVNQEPNK